MLFIVVLAPILAMVTMAASSSSRTSVTAVRTLFDLSQIDLDAVAVSYEDVGRINPHRGHMRQLDHMIWMSADGLQALGVKYVRDDEYWVAGHMPGQPLYPLPLMIEAAAQVCSIQFQLRERQEDRRFIGFSRCDDAVCHGQVVHLATHCCCFALNSNEIHDDSSAHVKA